MLYVFYTVFLQQGKLEKKCHEGNHKAEKIHLQCCTMKNLCKQTYAIKARVARGSAV